MEAAAPGGAAARAAGFTAVAVENPAVEVTGYFEGGDTATPPTEEAAKPASQVSESAAEATGEVEEPQGEVTELASAIAEPAKAAEAEEEAGTETRRELDEDLFGSGDEGTREGSLAEDADLFGGDPPAAVAEAETVAADSYHETEAAAANSATALSPEDDGEANKETETHKYKADDLPPQEIKLSPPWIPNLPSGSSVFTWKIPPAISLISSTDTHQQERQQGLAIRFSYDESAAAEGRQPYTSNCRLVQFSDDSYCLFIDDQGFECNVKEDVSYIFEAGGAKDALCSVFSTDRRLQVLMRAGLGADSFFYNSKKAERLQHKTQTALTTAELVAAAELAHKQAFISRQEAARSRRAQAESQRGLTRGFLEAEDSDQEDEQGESLEKIKERFKRRRF